MNLIFFFLLLTLLYFKANNVELKQIHAKKANVDFFSITQYSKLCLVEIQKWDRKDDLSQMGYGVEGQLQVYGTPCGVTQGPEICLILGCWYGKILTFWAWGLVYSFFTQFHEL